MFVLNKKTGLTWNVEGELLERLLKSPNYEIIESKEKPVRKPRSKKGSE